MQKVGEERKKEKKSLERVTQVGDTGLLPGLLLQKPEFLNISPKLSHRIQDKGPSNMSSWYRLRPTSSETIL